MNKHTLEPGLLAVFRLFMAIRLGIYLLMFFLWLGHLALGLSFAPHTNLEDGNLFNSGTIFDLFLLIDAVVIVVYLWWAPVQRRLGRWFLPVGLLLATMGPLLGHYLHQNADTAPKTEVDILIGAWNLVPILFVPLVLIAWQYNFRAVLLYSIGTALLDYHLTVVVFGPQTASLANVEWIILARTVAFLLVGYIIVKLVSAQQEQRRALAQANAKLAHYATTLEQLATSRERNRLARELHDTLAHTLSGTAVQLEAVKTLWNSNPEQALEMVNQSQTDIRTGLTETRRALKALRASPLEDLGLTLALHDLAESVAAQTGATLDWQGPEQLENISPVVEQGVYRVAQEAFENITKHAGATRVSVWLNENNGQTEMKISDNGCGFIIDEVDAEHHFGLQGMQERIEMIGGVLHINSRPGQGTTIQLTVEKNSESRNNL